MVRDLTSDSSSVMHTYSCDSVASLEWKLARKSTWLPLSWFSGLKPPMWMLSVPSGNFFHCVCESVSPWRRVPRRQRSSPRPLTRRC